MSEMEIRLVEHYCDATIGPNGPIRRNERWRVNDQWFDHEPTSEEIASAYAKPVSMGGYVWLKQRLTALQHPPTEGGWLRVNPDGQEAVDAITALENRVQKLQDRDAITSALTKIAQHQINGVIGDGHTQTSWILRHYAEIRNIAREYLGEK